MWLADLLCTGVLAGGCNVTAAGSSWSRATLVAALQAVAQHECLIALAPPSLRFIKLRVTLSVTTFWCVILLAHEWTKTKKTQV